MARKTHTPAPWRSHHNSYIGWVIIGDNDTPVLSELRGKEELQANIALTAVAPEMHSLLLEIAEASVKDFPLLQEHLQSTAKSILKKIDHFQIA